MPARFARVQKGLYRGGCPTAEDLRILKNVYGVKKIVSLDYKCGHAIDNICKDLELEHVIWGLGDGRDPKVGALKKRIVPQLLHGGPTYVHCFHGKDRTGMTIAMFRIYTGWSVDDALAESFKFGMGNGLSPAVKQSYYDAVKDFAKEFNEDKDNVLDAVSLTREQNSFGPVGNWLDDMSIPTSLQMGIPPHADIEFSHLSRTASGRIFCKCKSFSLLKPKVYWWSSKEDALKNPTDEDGSLYSASLALGTKVERFDERISQKLIHMVLTRDIDAAALRNGQFLILDPGSLVNIQEEEDINDMFMPEVGSRDNSTDYTFAYPGSGSGVGGMPDGAAGIVQLPYSGQGQV
jgi:hypothetical protein